MKHSDYMELALKEAQLAYAAGEVPVGAVIVSRSTGQIISAAHNMRETCHDATAHAEVLAIREACKTLQDWRLSDCILYVTLEPCPMCSGAIINARLPMVVFGASDSIAGCAGSIMNITHNPSLPFRTEIIAGIEEGKCSEILKRFFAEKR